MKNYLKSQWIFFLTLFFGLWSYGFEPTRDDVDSVKSRLGKISSSQKVIVISDTNHRFSDTRAAALVFAQAAQKRFPSEKICMVFETSEKIEISWQNFKKGDGTRSSYSHHFLPLAKKLSDSVSGLSQSDAGRIFIEPPYFMARYLKEYISEIDVFGGDVDYTNNKEFSILYENAKPPRKLSDDAFAKIFIADRNKSMAAKINTLLRTKKCKRVIATMGDMHVRTWKGSDIRFPNYSGGPIPGVIDLLDIDIAGEPYVVSLEVESSRVCKKGMAKVKRSECKMRLRSGQENGESDLMVRLPKNFYFGRVYKNIFDGKVDKGTDAIN